jgi:hypothetical protein
MLQSWVDDADHQAFAFARLEDGFYDKRKPARPGLFFYDTGDPDLTWQHDPSTPWDTWGSIYHMEFVDKNNPAAGARLTLLARSSGPDDGWASPDNGDMNANGIIMLQEDPAATPWNRPPAIWGFRLNGKKLVDPKGTKIAQLKCPGSGCTDADVVNWESSGIIDASEWFGHAAWLWDIQAGGYPVPNLPGADGGQLLLMKLRGEN